MQRSSYSIAQYGPIARITSADFTATTDQLLTWLVTNVPTLWVPRRVIARRVTGAYGVGCLGGIYTAASKAGNALVAATQTWAGLSGAAKITDATLAAVGGTDIQTSSTVYLALSTGNTGALTADVYLFGDILA